MTTYHEPEEPGNVRLSHYSDLAVQSLRKEQRIALASLDILTQHIDSPGASKLCSIY